MAVTCFCLNVGSSAVSIFERNLFSLRWPQWVHINPEQVRQRIPFRNSCLVFTVQNVMCALCVYELSPSSRAFASRRSKSARRPTSKIW
jgi:hypothetical protein